MKVAYTLESCVDCVAYAANGTIPEDRPDLFADISANIGNPDHVHNLVNCDGCDDSGAYHKDSDGNDIDPGHPEYELYREDWFSWSGCECCGSTLGGNRNRLAVLVAE